MGYYVSLTNANFTIPAKHEAKALAALKALNKKNDLKRGGSWSQGGKTSSWFSWMPENYDQEVQSTADVFKLLGFEVESDQIDGTSLTEYDSKSGQEDLFLEAVAPFVKDGSLLEWEGEDGERYRDVVMKGKIVRQYGTVTVTWG